jgi:glycosyltransferase involved in cell wall biosynthesis
MPKKKIGIDTRMLHNTGIGTYLGGLVHNLEEAALPKEWDVCFYGQPPHSSASNRSFWSKIYTVQEQLEYPFRLKGCDLWHAPHYNVPLQKGKTKLVVTIHDLIHWIFRKDFFTPLQEFYAKKMLTAAVQKSDHIITVSHKTRNDLIEHFDAEPDKISVIYEGVSRNFHVLESREPVEQIRQKYALPKSYFLYVGMIKPHKNVLSLIKMFKELKHQKKIDAALVLVGKKDKKYPSDYEELSKLKTEDSIYHIPYVENDELIAFYNGALALVHPSLYEGFGLTLLEAMACGTPVIACRAASIPEVVGDAACLSEPCSQREMMDAMVRMEKSANLRSEYARKGILQAAKFRWEEMAKQTVEVYRKVLGTT